MKKRLSLLLATLLTLNVICVNALAANEGKNSSDLICEKNLVSVTDTQITFSQISEVAAPLTTAKLQGTTEETRYYKADAVSIVADKAVIDGIVAELAENGSASRNGTDSSITAHLYSTVYFSVTKRASDGLSLYSITSINGRYTMAGSGSTSVVSQSLAVSQTGMVTGSPYPGPQTDFINLYWQSWTYTPPSSWVPVNTLVDGNVGCNYTITLRRSNGYTWEYTLPNSIDAT